jgi:hypothetical protein
VANKYQTEFNLTLPVKDLDKAREYLAEDVAKYLRKEIEAANEQALSEISPDNIVSLKWELDNEQSGHITLLTKSPLTDNQLKAVSGFISGQNSDGLGAGFEQGDFAEYYDEEAYKVAYSDFENAYFNIDDYPKEIAEAIREDLYVPTPDDFIRCATFDYKTNDYRLEEKKLTKEEQELIKRKEEQEFIEKLDDFLMTAIMAKVCCVSEYNTDGSVGTHTDVTTYHRGLYNDFYRTKSETDDYREVPEPCTMQTDYETMVETLAEIIYAETPDTSVEIYDEKLKGDVEMAVEAEKAKLAPTERMMSFDELTEYFMNLEENQTVSIAENPEDKSGWYSVTKISVADSKALYINMYGGGAASVIDMSNGQDWKEYFKSDLENVLTQKCNISTRQPILVDTEGIEKDKAQKEIEETEDKLVFYAEPRLIDNRTNDYGTAFHYAFIVGYDPSKKDGDRDRIVYADMSGYIKDYDYANEGNEDYSAVVYSDDNDKCYIMGADVLDKETYYPLPQDILEKLEAKTEQAVKGTECEKLRRELYDAYVDGYESGTELGSDLSLIDDVDKDTDPVAHTVMSYEEWADRAYPDEGYFVGHVSGKMAKFLCDNDPAINLDYYGLYEDRINCLYSMKADDIKHEAGSRGLHRFELLDVALANLDMDKLIARSDRPELLSELCKEYNIEADTFEDFFLKMQDMSVYVGIETDTRHTDYDVTMAFDLSLPNEVISVENIPLSDSEKAFAMKLCDGCCKNTFGRNLVSNRAKNTIEK